MLDQYNQLGWTTMGDILGTSTGRGFLAFSALVRLVMLPHGIYNQIYLAKMSESRPQRVLINKRVKEL